MAKSAKGEEGKLWFLEGMEKGIRDVGNVEV